MGKPLALDWQDIRTLAIAIGLREAIRQMGLEKHADAIMQRSARENWFAKQHAAQAVLDGKPAAKAEIIAQAQGSAVSIVSNGLSAAEILADLPKRTHAKLSVAADKAAETYAEKTGDEIIADSQAFKNIVSSADTLHGYSAARAGAAGSTVVNIAFLAPPAHEAIVDMPLIEQ